MFMQADNGIAIRPYESYKNYIEHQQSKLKTLKSIDDFEFEKVLLERLREENIIYDKAIVICLGARTGGEVRVFKKMNYYSIGIDLNPGDNNCDVFPADFNYLPFYNNIADVVFTNALDHAYNINTLLDEMERILGQIGIIIIEIPEGYVIKDPGMYESTWWTNSNTIKNLFYKRKFKLIYENIFDFPWKGRQLRFRRLEIGEINGKH